MLVISSVNSKTLKKLYHIKNKINLLENDGKLFHESEADKIAIDENAVFFGLTITMEQSFVHGSISYPSKILENFKSHPSLTVEFSISRDIK